MNKTYLSIIITGFNVSDYISQAIISTLHQNIDVEYEVIAVDDCSQDNTFEIMQSFKYEFDKKGVKYTVIKAKKNGGVAYARAVGIAVAKGEYTLFLDGDDYYISDTRIKVILNEAINENIDSIIFDFRPKFSHKFSFKRNIYHNITCGKDAVLDYFNQSRAAMVWYKLWRTSIIK